MPDARLAELAGGPARTGSPSTLRGVPTPRLHEAAAACSSKPRRRRTEDTVDVGQPRKEAAAARQRADKFLQFVGALGITGGQHNRWPRLPGRLGSHPTSVTTQTPAHMHAAHKTRARPAARLSSWTERLARPACSQAMPKRREPLRNPSWRHNTWTTAPPKLTPQLPPGGGVVELHGEPTSPPLRWPVSYLSDITRTPPRAGDSRPNRTGLLTRPGPIRSGTHGRSRAAEGLPIALASPSPSLVKIMRITAYPQRNRPRCSIVGQEGLRRAVAAAAAFHTATPLTCADCARRSQAATVFVATKGLLMRFGFTPIWGSNPSLPSTRHFAEQARGACSFLKDHQGPRCPHAVPSGH